MKLSRFLIFAALQVLHTLPAQAQQSTLIIRSDAACTLTVNGMPQGQVQAGEKGVRPLFSSTKFILPAHATANWRKRW